jgi:hypothetical protein
VFRRLLVGVDHEFKLYKVERRDRVVFRRLLVGVDHEFKLYKVERLVVESRDDKGETPTTARQVVKHYEG